jgi:hypothetical protein
MPKAPNPSIVAILGGIAIGSVTLLGPVLRDVDVGATRIDCGGPAIRMTIPRPPRSTLKLEHQAYASCQQVATRQVAVGTLIGGGSVLVGIWTMANQRARREASGLAPPKGATTGVGSSGTNVPPLALD